MEIFTISFRKYFLLSRIWSKKIILTYVLLFFLHLTNILRTKKNIEGITRKPPIFCIDEDKANSFFVNINPLLFGRA